MRTHRIVFAAAYLLATLFAQAVKVDRPGEAEQNSTHILTGTVTAIYSKTTRESEYDTTRCVAEVRINSVEKGDGLKSGQTIYVRYIGSMKWIGKGPFPPGPGPHEGCPSEGQSLRMCLVKSEDGSFDAYYVSGFKPESKKP